jgi:hypothetical protein
LKKKERVKAASRDAWVVARAKENRETGPGRSLTQVLERQSNRALVSAAGGRLPVLGVYPPWSRVDGQKLSCNA